jgi:hypothetical protein
MPRLNLYEQQTSAQGPRASGADTGAAPAQAMGEMGNVVADIGARIQRREELFASDQIMGEIDTWAVTALDDFQKRQDITTQQALPEFQNALKQKKQEALSKFNGSPESRAALERQLDNQMTQYGKSAIGAKIKAGHEQLTRGLNQQFDKSANEVGTAPQILQDSISENVAYVESRKAGMTGEMYQQAMVMARAKPIQSAVQSYVSNGNWAEAEAIMADPEVVKLLDPSVARPLRIDIAVGRGKQETETKRQDLNVQKFQMRLGRDLTPEETIKARSLPAKKDMTPADEITELELVQGKPASQDQVDKIFKTYVEGGKSDTMFGKGTTGLAMAYVTEKAVEYANGFLSPAEARRFESSYAEAYMPKNREDPVTGTVQKIAPTIPKFAEEAMRRGSAIYGGLTAGVTPLGPRDNLRPPGETTTMFIDGKSIGSGVADASGRWSIPAPSESGAAPAGGAPAAAESPVKGRGLWSMASKVAGPVAGVQRAIGGGPLPFGIGAEEVAAEQYVLNQQKSLVRALQQNPRYAEGERKSIEQDIAIKPETMGNPRAFQLRLVEIGKYIDEELRFNAKVLQNPTGTTVQQRQQAMQSNAALSQFYDQLELPIKVKSLGEAQKLPSNVEEFLDENWILRDGPARRRK